MKFFIKVPAHVIIEVDTDSYKHLGSEPTVEQVLNEWNNPLEGQDDPRVMAHVEGWGDFYPGEVTVCDDPAGDSEASGNGA